MLRRLIQLSALAGVLLGGSALAQEPTGEPAAGQKVFRKCMACHTVEPGVNRVGPSLHGVVGREIASVPDFGYSPPMQEWAGGRTWTPELLDTFLTDPRGTVAGTTMVFAGLRDAQDRADVIAYLESVAD